MIELEDRTIYTYKDVDLVRKTLPTHDSGDVDLSKEQGLLTNSFMEAESENPRRVLFSEGVTLREGHPHAPFDNYQFLVVFKKPKPEYIPFEPIDWPQFMNRPVAEKGGSQISSCVAFEFLGGKGELTFPTAGGFWFGTLAQAFDKYQKPDGTPFGKLKESQK